MKKTLKKYRDKLRDKASQKTTREHPKHGEVPSITNTTVEQHRDEVLSSARKYIYPLQHSKHKIVLITTAIFVVTVVAFFSYCTLALYKMRSSSGFLYRVTQVIPFPVARIGGHFVAYENYLFELRRYTHYYQTQQKLDFQNNEFDKQQLADFEKRALDKVIDFAYIKEIAKEKNVNVSNQEVQNEITLLRDQNRLGSGDRVFEDVLKDYFGWSKKDFERYLYQELLTQKVVATLDTATTQRANEAYQMLQSGKKFSKVAKKYSDDVTSKSNGGEFGFAISKDNRDLTPEATAALFGLKTGEYSTVVNTGYSLEIFKVLGKKDGKIQAAHILFNFKDVNSYINDLKDKQKARVYINLPTAGIAKTE
jgi:parvulin-like peptidyl-prolyl isomerase